MSTDLSVLVVDDERLSRQTSVRQLSEAGYRADAVETAERALEAIAEDGWEIVLCDLRMPGMDGLELLRAIRHDHPEVDVILMTAYATVETAVAAIHEGAADYLTKPFHFRELEHKLRRLAELRTYRRELSALRTRTGLGTDCFGIVGASAATRAVQDQIRAFGPRSSPALITGASGTGKELVARALHLHGPCAGGPFVAVACGVIPSELADSELFGPEPDPGTPEPREGAIERACGGTLLLDQVDVLPLATQARLIGVLRGDDALSGAAPARANDVRVVATSQTDLAAAAAAKRFDPQLYDWIRRTEIRLQPLRERGEDIIPLAEHFLRRCAERTGRPLVALSPEVAEILRHHDWPGNVRELRNVLESLLVSCAGGTVEMEQLPTYLRGAEDAAEGLFTLHLAGRESIPFSEVVSRVEARLLGWALRQAGGQQRRAAELLGLPRTTFQSKLRQRLPAGDHAVNSNASKPG